MNPNPDHRSYPRVAVEWPAVFFTADFFSHGMVVDVSALAWRLRGAVFVRPGMSLGIRVWPQGPNHLEIEEARVLWAKGQEFAVELYGVRPEDESAMRKLQEATVGLSPFDQVRRQRLHEETIALSSPAE